MCYLNIYFLLSFCDLENKFKIKSFFILKCNSKNDYYFFVVKRIKEKFKKLKFFLMKSFYI